MVQPIGLKSIDLYRNRYLTITIIIIYLTKRFNHKIACSCSSFSSSLLCSAEGYCFNGECPTLDGQCEKIWGYGGVGADKQCYDQFNTKGSINGHCGTDSNGGYKKCELE